jgi:hypothetical protein
VRSAFITVAEERTLDVCRTTQVMSLGTYILAILATISLGAATYATGNSAQNQHVARKENLRSNGSWNRRSVSEQAGTMDEIPQQRQPDVDRGARASMYVDITNVLPTSGKSSNKGVVNLPQSPKKRFVVKCQGSVEKCQKEILETSGSPVKIVNYMANTDMFAVEMDAEQTNELGRKSHIHHLEDDQPRYLMHLPDSAQPISSRKLELEKQYNIGNINAPAVWDAYADLVGINAAKGSRAKVCSKFFFNQLDNFSNSVSHTSNTNDFPKVIDTGVKATHSDFDSSRLSGSTLGGLAWVGFASPGCLLCIPVYIP